MNHAASGHAAAAPTQFSYKADVPSNQQSRSAMRRRGLEPRHVIVAACFLATFAAYVERTGFSIAYTAAAKDHAVSEAVKGTVLSSFFWGYAVSQVSHNGCACWPVFAAGGCSVGWMHFSMTAAWCQTPQMHI